MRVLSFSTKFPSYHPRKWEPTYFVSKILSGLHDLHYDITPYIGELPICNTCGDTGIGGFTFDQPAGYECTDCKAKYTTIHKGPLWKAGDWFQPVIWGNNINPKSGRSGPYHSKQIKFAPPIEVKKIWFIDITTDGYISINGDLCGCFDKSKYVTEQNFLIELAQNDGLSLDDFASWFKYPGHSFSGQIICWNDKIEY